MFDIQWPENLSIFLDNLCIYHVFFDLVSFLTILFTWWFCKSHNTGVQDNVEYDESVSVRESNSSGNIDNTNRLFDKREGFNSLDDWNDDIVSNFKIMRQKALAKELQSKLTKDELEQEKKIEKMQLEKIFQLLQDQKDKFQMTSMQQLQDQLQLYRL